MINTQHWLLSLLFALALSTIPVVAQTGAQDSTLRIVYSVPADSLPPTRYPLFLTVAGGAGLGGEVSGPATMSIVYYRLGLGVISVGGGGVSRFADWEQILVGPVEKVFTFRLSLGQEFDWKGWSTTGSVGAGYTLGNIEDDTGSIRRLSAPGVTVDLSAFPRTHKRFSLGIHLTGTVNAEASYVALLLGLRIQ